MIIEIKKKERKIAFIVTCLCTVSINNKFLTCFTILLIVVTKHTKSNDERY